LGLLKQQQVPRKPDSFKNDNNKTLQMISATVFAIPGGITKCKSPKILDDYNSSDRFKVQGYILIV
jgi:hypothetical protein